MLKPVSNCTVTKPSPALSFLNSQTCCFAHVHWWQPIHGGWNKWQRTGADECWVETQAQWNYLQPATAQRNRDLQQTYKPPWIHTIRMWWAMCLSNVLIAHNCHQAVGIEKQCGWMASFPHPCPITWPCFLLSPFNISQLHQCVPASHTSTHWCLQCF